MNTKRSVTEVARNFAEYVNRVSYKGESFVLMRGKRPVAELRPVPAGMKLGELLDLLASMPRLDSAELDEFEKDIADARREVDAIPIMDPWDS
ncbi:MAG TPA: hypothetical protein VFE05_08455 [Longimicrobiaceae bacterium]|nr:hypothetical protein [Longimicrobiaceae bacterium]